MKHDGRANHPADGPALILPSPLPVPPKKSQPSTPPASLKRPAPDYDIVTPEPSSKRKKVNGPTQGDVDSSPRKKRRLEEDGLILLDNANDQLEDDVIEID
jgi:ubiquitin-like 1-activating enzyme E1 B